MLSGNKPLPEPILTPVLCCHRVSPGHSELTPISGGLVQEIYILKKKHTFILHHFSERNVFVKVIEILQMAATVNVNYYGCRGPGYVRSQGISNHGIDLPILVFTPQVLLDSFPVGTHLYRKRPQDTFSRRPKR